MKRLINLFIGFVKNLICAENSLIRDFQKENNIFIDPEKQIKHEEKKEGNP